MRWLSNVYKTKKYSSLVLNLPTPEMIDTLIRNSLIVAKKAKIIARFDQAASLTRCYRCQAYGHIARTCRDEIRCAECNQTHDTRSHEIVAPAAIRACAAYNKKGYVAYDKNCLFKIKIKKCTTRRLEAKRPFYEQQQQQQQHQ